MRLKPYYCPHCKRFKRSYQVTNVDAYDFGNCKHCGSACIATDDAIQRIVSAYMEDSMLTNGIRDPVYKKGFWDGHAEGMRCATMNREDKDG